MLDPPTHRLRSLFTDLFTGLLDDASMFPPATLPLQRALTEHHGHRASWYADLVGPFLCPVSRLDALRAALPAPDGDRLALSLVVDTDIDVVRRALDRVADDPRLALVGLEARHVLLAGGQAAILAAELARTHPAARGYLEVGPTRWDDTFRVVADAGWSGVKFRTGGTTADDFPPEPTLAAFLTRCAGSRTPFKLTAGLHHLVRGSDQATGRQHHGVLNVLAAAAEAGIGGAAAAVEHLLRSTQSAELLGRLQEPDAAAGRQLFRSFGCCAVLDPLGEALEFGVLDAHAAPA
jgi:hypothetical protein